MKHLISAGELSREEVLRLFELAADLFAIESTTYSRPFASNASP